MATGRTPIGSRANRTGLAMYRVASAIFALLVLVQAVLAGQFLNGRPSLVAVHRGLGAQVLPLLGLVLVVLAVRGARRFLALAVALFALTTLQTGLGFLGRSSLGAAAWHLPLGVAIFGLAVYQVAATGGFGRR